MGAALDPNPLRWVRLGGWAVLDQTLFATSNFTLGILLARWLPPAEFGAFTIAQSVFLLFGVFHIALLAEPMLVFGTSRYADNFSSYLGYLVKGHWLITGAGAVLLLIGAAAFWIQGSRSLPYALLGASMSTPPMLLVWLARRASFACLRPHYAAMAGAGYLLLMMVGISVLYWFRLLSPLYAFLVLGVCSLFVGAVLIRVLDKMPGTGNALRAGDIAWEHWRYGRWALASSTIAWLTGNVYFFVLPISGGLASAGAFRALSNLVLPMFQVIAALSLLLLPTLARTRGTGQFRSVAIIALVGLVGSAALYWVAVASLSKPVMALLYRGYYIEYANLLWLVGSLPVIAGLVAVVSNALRACERPDLVFWAYTVSGSATLSFGLWVAVRWGITGAVLGQILASSAGAALMVTLFRHHRSRTSSSNLGDGSQRVSPAPPFVRLPRGHPA